MGITAWVGDRRGGRYGDEAMKAEVKVPKGWRRVTQGKIREGDRQVPFTVCLKESEWELIPCWSWGVVVYRYNGFVIRRRPGRRGK